MSREIIWTTCMECRNPTPMHEQPCRNCMVKTVSTAKYQQPVKPGQSLGNRR